MRMAISCGTGLSLMGVRLALICRILVGITALEKRFHLNGRST